MVSPIIDMRCGKHSGVSGIATQLLVLHSGETPLRGGYAQAITDWGDTPLDQGGPEASWQWFVDPIAIVNMIDVEYTAWHATWANPLSEGMEQAGYARFSFEEWTTAEGLKQMDNLAWLFAQRCKAAGIPARWLTTAEVNAVKAGNRSIKGLCTHAQVDPAQRTDPGNNYPYDMLMAKIHGYMGGVAPASNSTPIAEEDFLMALTPDEENAFKRATFTKAGQEERARVDADVLLSSRLPILDGGEATVGDLLATVDLRLKEIKKSTDLLPSLNDDTRGEFDVIEARSAATDLALQQVIALLGEKQGLSVEAISEAVAARIAEGITFVVQAKAKS